MEQKFTIIQIDLKTNAKLDFKKSLPFEFCLSLIDSLFRADLELYKECPYAYTIQIVSRETN